MTLEEAIEHYKGWQKVASSFQLEGCAAEHGQLAGWLTALKAVRDIIDQHDKDNMPENFWYIDRIREAVFK